MSGKAGILAIILLGLVAGCGRGVSGEPAAPAAGTSTTTTTPPPVTTTTPPIRTTESAPPGTPARCTTADLTLSLGREDGTAGTIYRALVFANTGRRTCTIQGFPGVSFVAGDDGHQVGQAAAWWGAKGPVITLKPGEAANAALGFVDIGVFDPATCRPTPVRGLRVYPPHDTKAAYVPFPTTACAGRTPSDHLHVDTVRPGTGPS